MGHLSGANTLSTDYLQQIQAEFAHITAHGEDDLEWWNEGLDLIDQGNLDQAEERFKMLVMSQPDNFDGYEGLAMVYAKLNRLEEALYFSDLAVEKATKLHQKGYIDQAVLRRVQKTRRSIAQN